MGRQTQRTFQKVTWDQAEMLRFATVRQLALVTNVTPSTLRNWASAGHIHPVAQAPGGAFLYHVPTVLSAAKWIHDHQENP